MISLAAEQIAHIGPIAITNTLTSTLIVDAALIGLAVYAHKNFKLLPGKFQSIIEMIMEGFHNLTEQVAGKNTAQIFPYVMTFFLFILVANWSGLLPVISSLGFYHHTEHGEAFVPLVRATSTDLNTTLALALVSLVATHTMSIQTLGFKSYITRFFPLNIMGLYQGILELVSEITKIVSFSFRLFGNIFVGEVMLASLTTAFAFFLPIPVIMYEFFVGMIQATIFALLTMAFMALFTTPHGSESH
ncbi:MAG: F0F1 ATP synthase subunit A [Candidatus Levybacteria bacterium]|nr:F0F1 ATP synthase subunit A [Candidatus Levybacteria bacterium]